MRYKIIDSSDQEEFEQMVNREILDHGWKLAGGVCVVPFEYEDHDGKHEGLHFFQALFY
jgi:hypothetical protein